MDRIYPWKRYARGVFGNAPKHLAKRGYGFYYHDNDDHDDDEDEESGSIRRTASKKRDFSF